MEARRFLVASAVLAAAVVMVPQVAAATTYTVNAGDDLPGACNCLHCTLRAAINAANASAGRDVIVFDIPPGGPQSIMPIGPLPGISDPVVIDATTQPGYAGSPIIELDGSAAPGRGFDIGAPDTTIEGFVVNRFRNEGIFIAAGAPRAVIQGNFVGTDVSGTLARPNNTGVEVHSSDNLIGGTTPEARNVLSGNNNDGVEIDDGFSNTVVGNYIGTNAAGTAAVNQQNFGVYIRGAGANTIGGSSAGQGNVISGNFFGIIIELSDGNVVQGNFVGTNAGGTGSVPNFRAMQLDGVNDMTIGGSDQGARNVVSGNDENAIEIGFGARNVIQGNDVGVDVDGRPLGNRGTGVALLTANNFTLLTSDTKVGGTGPGEGNVIAYNGFDGVDVQGGLGNAILGNSIHDNGFLGIDLEPGGPTPNDPGDADTGANDLQNFPMLTSSSTGSGTTNVAGTLDSHPNTTYLLEFFGNAACDETGFGEGQTLLADRFVTTDGTGSATFSFTFASQAGDVITATATDPNGNTSEFSNCSQATPIVVGSVTTLSPPNAVNPVGSSHTVTATVVGAGASAQPLAGITVFFSVSGSVDTSGQCTTGASGQCSFTYQGPNLPGADLIRAFADSNNNGSQDATEIEGAATKEWMLPASTPGQVTGGGQIVFVAGPVVFGFNAQNLNNGVKGNCNVIDQASRMHIKCVTLTNLVVAGTHATFFGRATIAGAGTGFRIDVDDLGEPGTGRDTFKIQTDSGYLAMGVLTAGNIQIHP